jgi:hypothetical protein
MRGGASRLNDTWSPMASFGLDPPPRSISETALYESLMEKEHGLDQRLRWTILPLLPRELRLWRRSSQVRLRDMHLLRAFRATPQRRHQDQPESAADRRTILIAGGRDSRALGSYEPGAFLLAGQFGPATGGPYPSFGRAARPLRSARSSGSTCGSLGALRVLKALWSSSHDTPHGRSGNRRAVRPSKALGATPRPIRCLESRPVRTFRSCCWD